MRWSEIFKINKSCQHNMLPIDEKFGYCPECGEYIETHWYIIRCNCCGIKTQATIKDDKIVPYKNFCTNCGNHQFIIEELEALDCININYAVAVRSIVNNNETNYSQSWIEKQEMLKLLQSNL